MLIRLFGAILLVLWGLTLAVVGLIDTVNALSLGDCLSSVLLAAVGSVVARFSPDICVDPACRKIMRSRNKPGFQQSRA